MTITPNYDTSAQAHGHVTQGKHYACTPHYNGGVEITDNNGESLQIGDKELAEYWDIV